MWPFYIRAPQNSGLCPNVFKGRKCHSTTELSCNVIGIVIVWIALRYSNAHLHSEKQVQAGEWLGVVISLSFFFFSPGLREGREY